MKNQQMKLGRLVLAPIADASVKQSQAAFAAVTLPKIREDVRRNAQNVAKARVRIALAKS